MMVTVDRILLGVQTLTLLLTIVHAASCLRHGKEG